MLSLGFLFFFFIGRFLFFAFAVAAVFGLVFMAGRRARTVRAAAHTSPSGRTTC